MTKKQRIFLQADLWPAACAAQGWTPNDRAKRLEVISQALGRFVSSANEILTNADFDLVKRRLRTLSLNLAAAGEADSEGRARRLRHKILDVIGAIFRRIGQERGEAYVLKIIADKFNHGLSPSVEKLWLEDLTADPMIYTIRGRSVEGPSQLDQLLMTLTARERELRAVEGEPAPMEYAGRPF